MRQKATSISLSPQLFLYQKKTPFYLGELYYESMTESILNLGTRLIDDGFDEFIMITANPHVLSRNKRKNMQNTRCS